jgi:hypothetical protein
MLRSFTLLALSICTVASASAAATTRTPRPTHAKDTRVYVTLVNQSTLFRDVKIDGRNYTLMPHELLAIKAPVGTVVYAASSFARMHRGDTLVALTPSLDHSRVTIN